MNPTNLLNNDGKILLLLYTMEKPMYAKKIAERLRIADATVVKRLQDLQKQELLIINEIGPIITYELNSKGKEYAIKCLTELQSLISSTVIDKITSKIEFDNLKESPRIRTKK